MWYLQVSLPGGSRIDTYRLKASLKVLVPSVPSIVQYCPPKGTQPNQTKAKGALKVLYIEQLGLPSWIRTLKFTKLLAKKWRLRLIRS